MKIQKPLSVSNPSQIQAPSTAQGASVIQSPAIDQVVSGGPSVQLPAQQAEPSVGRPGSSSGRLAVSLQPIELSPGELAQVGGMGGAGLKGRGTLQGEVSYEDGRAYLITAAKKSKSEVRFLLDLPRAEARALHGQQVSIRGMIEKKSNWSGKITGAKQVSEVAGIGIGSHQTLSGTIENRHIMAIGGEAPPSGSYLILPKPITVAGKEVSAVFVQRYPELEEGAQVTLHGRIDERQFGGVETPQQSVIALTGVSNVSAGEPIFDGKVFTNSLGKELQMLRDGRPEMYDAAGVIFVLDQSHDTAFIGGMGGHIMPTANQFHGFTGTAKIEEPTDADRQAVTFGPDGTPKNATTGDDLYLVGQTGNGPAHPDQMTQSYYLDDTARAIYRFDSGGIAGFMNDMFQVIRLPAQE